MDGVGTQLRIAGPAASRVAQRLLRHLTLKLLEATDDVEKILAVRLVMQRDLMEVVARLQDIAANQLTVRNTHLFQT